MNPVRAVLADDHEMVREALARILEDSGRVRVVAQASDCVQAVAAVRRERPALLILDYSMPGEGTPDTIEQLIRTHVAMKILVLTVHENIHYAVRVLEAGAHGYLIKAAAVDELVEAVETVSRGDVYLSPRVAQEVLQRLRRPKRERAGVESLSQREFDLLRMIGAGNTLQQCARSMHISTSTASTYRARILEKLGLSNTAELIRFALEHGLTG